MPVLAIAPIIGGIIGAVGAAKAGGAQASAAQSAAQLQHQDQMASLDFQKQQWNTEQQNLAPWLKAGGQAENTLAGLLGTPGQGLLTPFQAPTAATEQNDPGYQFRLQQGSQALQNSAAARGGILSGNTAQAITQYGQDYASNEYNNVYNRAFGQYQQQQSSTYNMLSGLAGGGQMAANTLGQLGQSAAGNISNINLVGGQQQGQDLMAAGSARASGYAGAANAIGGGVSGLGQYLLLQQLLGKQPSAGGNI